MSDILTIISDFIDDLPNGGTLLSLLVCGGCYFGFGWCFGWVGALIPFLRWFIFAALILMGIKHFPASVNPYEMITFTFWGMVTPFVQRLWKKANFQMPRIHASAPLARPRFDLRDVLRPRRNPFGFIARFCGWLWKIVCGLCYFLFVRIPARLIRLGFWLKNVIPTLNTWAGWWNLIKGLFAWIGDLIWIALPPEIRSEFRRGMSGKNAHQSFGKDVKDSFYREQKRQKKREEAELWRMFAAFKNAFKKEAREGRDPFANGQPDLDPKQYKKTEQERRAEKRQQKRERDWYNDPSHDPFVNPDPRGSDFYSQQRRKSQKAKQERTAQSSQQSKASGKSQQSSKSNNSQRSTQSSQQSEYWKNTQEQTTRHEQKITPLSKAFYDTHVADFDSAGWTYDPIEERFIGGKSAYEVLGVSSSSDNQERKKAYRALSKQFHPFTASRYPTTVQERANEIMKVVNAAKDKLIRK